MRGAPALRARSGSKTAGQDVVLHADQAAGGLGRRRRLGDDSRNPLADVAHDVVEDAGVVGVVLGVLVSRRRESARGRIAMREDRDHTVEPLRLGGVDVDDPRMRVRAREHADHQRIGYDRIERVGLETLHDASRGGRVRTAPTPSTPPFTAAAVPVAASPFLRYAAPVCRTAPTIESRIDRYPVQRQMLPFMRVSRLSRSDSVRVDAVTAMPGVQNPHWKPKCSTSAS